METLFQQMRNDHALLFHDKLFQDFLEMNMADLRKSSRRNSVNIEISETQKVRADRNFNLLCNIAGIPYHLHWVTMRVNGLKRVSDYRYNIPELIEVDNDKLSSLILQFGEAQSIT